MKLLQLQAIFSLWLALIVVEASSLNMSLPNCEETCGNVTIPYPFGIGPTCSANSNFTITCQNYSINGSSIPFLSSVNMEVLNISVHGTIVVSHPVTLMNNCSNGGETISLGGELIGTPFTFSPLYNSLTNLGCLSSVWVRPNKTTTTGGCMSICEPTSTDTSCNGVNCCQATIQPLLQELQVFTEMIQHSNNYSTCGYVFLVDKNWFIQGYRMYSGLLDDMQNPFDQDFRTAPVVLEWELFPQCVYNMRMLPDPYYLETLDYQGTFPISYYTINKNGEYINSRIACICPSGYEGNPYIDHGCVDIEECTTNENICLSDTCVNTIGSYRCDPKKSRAKQALIGIGSGLGALVLLILAWRGFKFIRRRIKANRKQRFFKKNGGLLLEQQISTADNGLDMTKLFSSKELARATDHYNENRILGGGGQGTVYKGMLTDGRIVAIKKSKTVDENDLQDFINEVVILSQINHRNVVKLLGCCLETEVPILVYEFIPNGTLFHHIHEPNEDFPLSWEMRMRIVREIIAALSYLHYSTSAPIYHRDIKSTNILLDDKYRAKVADFGTSRSVSIEQTHLTTRVLGTFGYLDPEYFQSSQFTEKSDVYSFGVVMVELFTGEKAISSIRSEDVGRSLATRFLNAMEQNSLFDIIDECILKETTREEIVAIAEIAKRCLHLNGKKRPSTKEIAVELERIHMEKDGYTIVQTEEDNAREFCAINVTDHHQYFSSIQETIYFDAPNTDTSDDHPLLLGNS